MANKVNVSLEMNVQGYVDGMNQATESTAQYETETRKVQDSTVNLNKELRNAKREAQNLAAGFAKLTKEEKASSFGREMARQLDEAKQKAAEYIDLQGDLNTELKNMASDTATFDVLSDGLSGLGSTMSAVTGVMGIFTDDTELMTKAVTMFTTAESIASAAIKVKNLLQKQSSLMLGITRLQQMAETAAIEKDTVAKGANTAATKGMTLAQKAFNAVAKANPYVLLFSALIALGGAIGGFIALTNQQTTAQKIITEVTKAQEDSYETYKSTLASTAADAIYKYRELSETWKTLKTEHEKNQFIKDNQKEFNEYKRILGETATAEDVFDKMGDQVVDSLIKRAKAAAKAAQAQILYQKAVAATIEYQNILEQKNRDLAAGPLQITSTVIGSGGQFGTTQSYSRTETREEMLDRINKKYDEQLAIQKGIENSLNNQADILMREAAKEGAFSSVPKPKPTITTTGQDKHDTEEEVKSQLQLWKEELKKQEKALEFTIKGSVEEENAKAEIIRLSKLIADEEARLKVEVPVEVEPPQVSDLSKINDEINNALNPKVEKSSLYDFSSLPEEFNKAADQTIDAMHRIESARINLTKIMNENDSTDAEIAAAQEGLDKLNYAYDELASKADVYQELCDAAEKLNAENEKIVSTINSIGGAVQAAGELFSALGEVADDDGLKVTGIVAKAVATVALSYAQALTTAKSWVDWLAFGVSGLATMVTMISQIKSATAGSYAQGGIIPGSSYYGDRLTANVNSGEMILNQRQQKNLFNMLDLGAMPQHGGTNVQVTGVVRGTDLLLVQKNTNKVRAKSGSQIYF